MGASAFAVLNHLSLQQALEQQARSPERRRPPRKEAHQGLTPQPSPHPNPNPNPNPDPNPNPNPDPNPNPNPNPNPDPDPNLNPTQAAGDAEADEGLVQLISARPTGGCGGPPWGGLRYGGIWAGMALALLRIEEQKPQLPPPPPPKGGEAMSTMRLLASGYSAKAVTVSTMSAHMCDYGEDL